MVVFTNIRREALLSLLKKKKFVQEKPGIYEEFRFRKGGVVLVLYTSEKLLLQGKEEQVQQLAEELEKAGIGKCAGQQHFRKEEGFIIGSDEALKGDTFGGIVVAAVKADAPLRDALIALGAADSKDLSDAAIQELAPRIRAIAPCEVQSILPEEYNRAFKHLGSVTLLLNKMHKEVARDLLPGKHIVDKYPGCVAGDVQEEKAESKYVEVAAASILARAAALQQMEYLSRLAGFTLPKGSTHVKLALLELKERKLEFRKLVKVDFRNVKGVL